MSRDEAQFEILDLPKKGFLGLGSSPAKVRVFIEFSKAQCAVDYLQSIFDQMGLDHVQDRRNGNGKLREYYFER